MFYLGSQELESSIHKIIQEHLDFLGFTERDLILSGMSMGTYGAVYYGSEFRPRAIVLSKPLGNLGTIAQRGRFTPAQGLSDGSRCPSPSHGWQR